jgi:hypothetical protein
MAARRALLVVYLWLPPEWCSSACVVVTGLSLPPVVLIPEGGLKPLIFTG